MSDTEALLFFLSCIVPFGGMANIIVGIAEHEKSKLILGIVCIISTIFIMGYSIYKLKKGNTPIAIYIEKTKLFVWLFRYVIIGCFIMIAEFLVLSPLNLPIRCVMAIISISLVIMTAIANLLQKL